MLNPYTQHATPLYTSQRSLKNLWQRYHIYPDHLELQSWILLHTLTIPLTQIRTIQVRPPSFRAPQLIWGAKLDNADFCTHILLTRTRGILKSIAFTPDHPDQFADICQSLLPQKNNPHNT